MAKLIKQTCGRCGGSGHFSFNLVRGTVCFGCEGAGFVMVDAAKAAKLASARAKREAERETTAARRAELAEQVRIELDAELGPFPNTEKGAYDRVCACRARHGKTPGDIVQERLRAA